MAHGFDQSDGVAIGSGLASRGEATLEEGDGDLLDALEEGRVGTAAEAEMVGERGSDAGQICGTGGAIAGDGVMHGGEAEAGTIGELAEGEAGSILERPH